MPRVSFLKQRGLPPVASVACTETQMRTTHMVLAALLDYPGKNFTAALDAYAEVRTELPGEIVTAIDAFAQWAREHSVQEIQEHYVDTFDQQRRCALYLSYYLAGDTRLRGSALLGFREFVRALGYEKEREELDDYLPLILELSARSGDPLVWELLASHQEGIEVMRAALAKAHSPYRHLLDAVSATLPEINDATQERFHRLISQGPPTEMVGVHLPNPWSQP